MNWWQWVSDFERRARAAGDAARRRLVSLMQQSYGYREQNPGRFLDVCEEGRRLAQALGEPWWVLAYQAATVGEFVHYLRDFRRALDLGVAAVLEARKPAYDGCPIRVKLYQDLLAVHFCIDPEGHAEHIEEGFRDVERETPTDFGSRLHLLNLRRWCSEQTRRPDEHYAAAQRVLALMAEDPRSHVAVHYSTYVYVGLCDVHYARGEWRELGEAACLAEEAAKTVDNRVELAEASLWQAVRAFHDGDSSRGRRLRRRGIHIMEALGVPPPNGYFAALSFGHEQAGQLQEALAVRDRELEILQRQGRTISEVYCQLQRCRLLMALGRLPAADLDSARATTHKLRFPERELAELDRLADSAGQTGSGA